jgi:hypothetical protein
MTPTKASLRKANKPLLEKRRRARINACLNQLKNLVLETLRKDTARYSKLEKADILEMTVDYLKTLRFQQFNGSGALKTFEFGQQPDVAASFMNADYDHRQYSVGYRECAAEIRQYLDSVVDPETVFDREARHRFDLHLADCVRRAEESPSVGTAGLFVGADSSCTISAALPLAATGAGYASDCLRRRAQQIVAISGDASPSLPSSLHCYASSEKSAGVESPSSGADESSQHRLSIVVGRHFIGGDFLPFSVYPASSVVVDCNNNTTNSYEQLPCDVPPNGTRIDAASGSSRGRNEDGLQMAADEYIDVNATFVSAKAAPADVAGYLMDSSAVTSHVDPVWRPW